MGAGAFQGREYLKRGPAGGEGLVGQRVLSWAQLFIPLCSSNEKAEGEAEHVENSFRNINI